MKLALVAVASALVVVVLGAAFLLYPSAEKAVAVPTPAARYWPTAKLEAQLAPKAQTFYAGTRLIIPSGWACDQFLSQALRRIVFVCKQL